MAHTAPPEDIWHVQLATGDVRPMTLDELDRAFHAGVLDAQSHVFAPGASVWVPLGQIAGLDASEAPEAEAPVASLAPVAMAPAGESSQPRSSGLDVHEDATDLDMLAAGFARRRRRMALLGGTAVGIALAGVLAVVAFTKLGATASAASAPPARQEMAQTPAAPPPAATTLDEASASRSVLSDEQRKRLLEADKKREADLQRKAKPAAPPSRAKGGSKSSGNSPFVNGGNKYDPLNGSL